MRNPARRREWDTIALRELELYIDNTEPLYRQSLAIGKNLITKIQRGRYQRRLAPKLWLYLVDAGARRYVKEFGGEVRTLFPLHLRQRLAKSYAIQFEKMLRSGEIQVNPAAYRVSASVGRAASSISAITPPEY